MSVWIGRRQAVGVGIESTRGVGVAPSYWMNCLSFSFSDRPERALSDAGFGGIWGGDQSPTTLITSEGQIEFELDSSSFGAILTSLFGASPSTTTVDTTGKKHTYTLQNDNQHKSLTIHTIDPIGQLVYEMAMIDTLELRMVPNEIISANVTFIGKGSGDSSGQTASYSATKKFLGRYLQFKVASTTSGLAGASQTRLKSLTLNFRKNVEANQVLATIQPTDIVNKKFEVSGEIVLDYEDRTWLNFVKNGTYRAIRINLIHDDLAGSVSQKYEFMLDLSKCSIEGFEPALGLDDIVTQKFTFNALYDAGGNNNVVNQCYLVNQIASY